MAKAFECSQADCSFEVHSEDEGEIVSMVREHAQNVHGMAMSESDVQSGMHEIH
jgi:predicted small metal-binding protein